MSTGNWAGKETQLWTDGAAHVRVVYSPEVAGGDSKQDDLWGDPVNKETLVNGSGKGPDVWYVDMRKYGRATFVATFATGTVTSKAKIGWSQDGDAAGDWHSEAADNLWAAVAGNKGAAITILDNFARITLEEVTGTAEDVYAYVVGREIA